MSEKNAKKLRKALKLKLPVKPDLRVLQKVKKVKYFTDRITGMSKAVSVDMITLTNLAKKQYRQIKKMVKKGELNV